MQKQRRPFEDQPSLELIPTPIMDLLGSGEVCCRMREPGRALQHVIGILIELHGGGDKCLGIIAPWSSRSEWVDGRLGRRTLNSRGRQQRPPERG